MNRFLTNPPKIVVVDPLSPPSTATLRAYVFLGDVPKGVHNAVTHYAASAAQNALLKDYYGNDYKKKLGLDIKNPRAAWTYPAVDPVESIIFDTTEIKTGADDGTFTPTHFAHPPTYSKIDLTKVTGLDTASKYGAPAVVKITNPGPSHAANHANYKVVSGAAEICDMILDGDFEPTLAVVEEGVSAIAGGDISDDLSDIEFLLLDTSSKPSTFDKEKQKEIVLAHGIEYVSADVYPEDKLCDLKDKIQLATGIPTYRQHLFYIDKGRVLTTYTIKADGFHIVDIRRLAGFTNAVLGLPVDKVLYDHRDAMKIEALDTFQILDELPTDVIYVVDLAHFTRRIRAQLTDILSDKYQFELLYYGFIVKYWPQLTPECFHDYIRDEDELTHKYPDLAKNKIILASTYRAESAIINNMYRNSARAEAYAAANDMSIAITSMIAVIDNPNCVVNIRNLFDKLRVSRCVPEIHAHVDIDNRRFLLRKRHAKNGSDIYFPTGVVMKTGVTIAVSLKKSDQDSYHSRTTTSRSEVEQSRYMFVCIWPNGRVNIKTSWNEEDEYDFEDIIKIMRKFTTPLLTAINNLGKYVFVGSSSGSNDSNVSHSYLQFVDKHNLSFQNLNVCVFWRKVMMESTFKAVRGLWDAYMRARICGPRNVQQFDRFEFLFRKGMHEFDTTAIERIVSASNNIILRNQYAFLSNNAVKQKWDQNYDGRIVKMTHRTTDVRFEVNDIRESEFDIFLHYLKGFVYNASSDPSVKAASMPRDYKNVKKLRKLREQDPELFNLKKHGSKRVYSRECQSKRQPIIFTAEEIKSMDTSKLTKYWNFTLNRPAYYGCPDKKYPHLSFIVGVHPKGYCLPCCNKKPETGADSKKTRVNTVCLRDHRYVSDEEVKSRHVMAYGKEVDIGRLSKLPAGALKTLLFGTLPANTNYYLFGVAQNMGGIECGLLFALSETLEMRPIEIIKKFTAAMNDHMFSTMLGGILVEQFSNLTALKDAMYEIFVRQTALTARHFKHWAELFVDLAQITFDLGIYSLIDADGSGLNVQLYVDDNMVMGGAHDKNMVVLRKKNKYYPVFAIDLDDHFRSGEVASRTYGKSTKIIQTMDNIVKHRIKTASADKIPDLNAVMGFCEGAKDAKDAKDPKYEIKCKYVNKQNLCYAVEIGDATTTTTFDLTIDYSVHTADGIKVRFDMRPRDHSAASSNSAMNITKFLDEFSKYLTTHGYQSANMTTVVEVNGKIIGAELSCGLMIYGTIDNTTVTTLPTKKLLYDPRDVNRAIIERKPPVIDNAKTKLGAALYNNHLYRLFIIEFANYLKGERNMEVRNRLKKLIQNTNFKKDASEFHKQLRNMVPAPDYNMIQEQLYLFYRSNNKDDILAAIDGSSYEFDRVTMGRIMSTDDKHAVVREICAKFTVERQFDTTTIAFPNIYIPCNNGASGVSGASAGATYCDGKKLVINVPLDDLVDILVSDLEHPLKFRYIFKDMMVLDNFSFQRHADEIVTVYKL